MKALDPAASAYSANPVEQIPNCPMQVPGILSGRGSQLQQLGYIAPRGNIQGEMGNARSLRLGNMRFPSFPADRPHVPQQLCKGCDSRSLNIKFLWPVGISGDPGRRWQGDSQEDLSGGRKSSLPAWPKQENQLRLMFNDPRGNIQGEMGNARSLRLGNMRFPSFPADRSHVP